MSQHDAPIHEPCGEPMTASVFGTHDPCAREGDDVSDTDRRRQSLDRLIEEAQERSRRNWNRLVERAEADATAAGVDPDDPAAIAAFVAEWRGER